MENEKIACTSLKCPLRNYCEHYRNHELKNTKSYFMADFDAEIRIELMKRKLKRL